MKKIVALLLLAMLLVGCSTGSTSTDTQNSSNSGTDQNTSSTAQLEARIAMLEAKVKALEFEVSSFDPSSLESRVTKCCGPGW